MAVDIKVPAVGESITEGTIARWFKKDGDQVRADEPVLELETEKATQEVVAPATGTLRVSTREGQRVTIGAVVGKVEEGAVTPTTDGRNKAPRPAEPKMAPTQSAPQPGPSPELVLSPAARQLIEERGIDAHKIAAPSGRITKEEVLAYLDTEKQPPSAQPAPAASGSAPRIATIPSKPPQPGTRETRQQMSAIRQRIAQRLVEAKNSTALLTTFNEADMSAIMHLRTKYKDVFQKQHDVGLGFMSFFAKACVEALKAHPTVNASMDGADVVYHHYYDIGIAVSTDKGLMVPVIRSIDTLSFAEIEKTIAALAKKARDGKIEVADLQGGTFTITNGGVFGSLLSTPILNPPQTAILGMHTIQKRAVVVEDQIVIRPMMYLALSYDHRLIDGREAVRFLVKVKECVEDPERMLLAI